MQLLLLSNSTLPGEKYLGWPEEHLKQFLGVPKRIAFVPFAAVTMSLDDYAKRTQEAFAALGHELFSLHSEIDKVKALKTAEAVAVGGGNSFASFGQHVRESVMGDGAPHRLPVTPIGL